jgi:hypothetical protein
MSILYNGIKMMTHKNKVLTIRKNKYKRQKNFKIENRISVSIILSFLLLFSTLSAFHIERSYAQSLEQKTITSHVPSIVLEQSLPYSLYATMVAEDSTDFSWSIPDVAI